MVIRFIFCFGLCSLVRPVFSQNTPIEQPVQPFPFSVQLLTADSLAHDSKVIFSKKNKATLLAFWLTTCQPCAFELEEYANNYAEWQKNYDLRIVAVSLDFPERFRKIGARLADKRYPFEVYWDPYRYFKEVMPGGINGLPQVFLFNEKGILVWQHKGYNAEAKAALLEQLKQLQE